MDKFLLFSHLGRIKIIEKFSNPKDHPLINYPNIVSYVNRRIIQIYLLNSLLIQILIKQLPKMVLNLLK